MRLVSHLKMYREAANLSIARLAEFTRISPQTIRNLESDKVKVNPTMQVAYLLAQYLGVSPVDLFTFESDDYFTHNTLADDILRLGEYLVYTYGDLGNPHTVEGLSNYPDCTAKFDLANLQGFDLTLL